MGTSLLAAAYQDCYWFKKIQFRYEEICQVLVICPEAETLNSDKSDPPAHSSLSQYGFCLCHLQMLKGYK